MNRESSARPPVPHADGAANRSANLTAAMLTSWVLMSLACFIAVGDSQKVIPLDGVYFAITLGATLGMAATGLVRSHRAGSEYRATLWACSLQQLEDATESDLYSRYEQGAIRKAIYYKRHMVKHHEFVDAMQNAVK